MDFVRHDQRGGYEEHRRRFDPLTDALRALIDVGIHTDVDDSTVLLALEHLEAAHALLEQRLRTKRATLRHADTGRAVVWGNPAIGLRNAIAPPMEIHREDDGSYWSEFTLGPAYEGPPGWVHGGVCALLLDHLLGEVASQGLNLPKYTGTISLRYLRGTRWDRCVPKDSSNASRVRRPSPAATSKTPTERPSRPRACSSCPRGPETRADRRVKTYVSIAFQDTREAIEVARVADELGYDGIGIPDHVVNLETLQTPYPYTEDGSRRWEAFTDWPDPG